MSKLEELIQQYCPDGVEDKKLRDILKIRNGRDYKHLGAGLVPVYGSGGIMTYVDASMYNKPSVLIPRKGSIDKIYYVDTPFWNVDTVFYTEINTLLVNEKYLFYALQKEHLEKLNTAGGVPSLTQTVLNDVQIPVPPLPVQEEIVRILDTFTELQAELQAELQKRKLQYNYYLDNLLNFNREGYQAEVRWMKMSDIASFTYGYTTKAQESGNVRYIRITDITDRGQLNPENGKYISLTEDVMPYLLQKGDLIMARTGATYGKTLYYNEDYPSVYASFLIKVSLNQLVDPKYYWHFSRSAIYWEQASRLVGGGAQPQFNTGAISQVKIPIPSLAEQQKIVSILDRFDSLTNDLSSGLPAEMEKRRQQYEYYRDKLLTFKRKGA